MPAVSGHERPKRLLKAALTSGRIPSGFLFYGARGRGKRLAALEFAKAALCGAHGLSACGRCPSCRSWAGPEHPDLAIVEPLEGRQSISIESVRELRARLNMSPQAAPRRIAVIDEAHTMTEEAQNSLLKILEEPPGAAVLFVCTPDPSALLETIRSRLFRVFFGPLPETLIALVKKSAPKADAAAVRRAWNLSEASPGRAVEILEEIDDELKRRLDRLFLADGKPFLAVEEIMGEKKKGKGAGGADREKLSVLVAAALDIVVERLEARCQGQAAAADDPLAVFGVERLCEIAGLLLEADGRLGDYVAPRLVLEAAAIRLQRMFAVAKSGR